MNFIKRFLIWSTVLLLLSGCAAVRPAESPEVKVDEEENVRAALLSCFSHLQKLEFEEANSYVYSTDRSYLFEPWELEWANEIFYHNLAIEVKNVEIQGDTAKVTVDMTICEVSALGQNGLVEIENSGKDYRVMTEEEVMDFFCQLASKYMHTTGETIIMSKTDGAWKMDMDKTKEFVSR